MLKDIKDYCIAKKLWCRYVPILDKDPEYAAKFLTKQDLSKAYKVLKEVYKEIENDKRLHELLYDTIMDSKDNFCWFSTFFKTIEEALKIPEQERYEIPQKRCPNNSGIAPNVLQPFYINHVEKNKGVILSYYSTSVKEKSSVNNYRIRYIVEDHNLEDFQDEQFPGWYILKNTTIYEQYNEKTNTRVRIDFRDGYFLYFLAGASDDWVLVPDVPIEMNHFISALLFRHLD